MPVKKTISKPKALKAKGQAKARPAGSLPSAANRGGYKKPPIKKASGKANVKKTVTSAQRDAMVRGNVGNTTGSQRAPGSTGPLKAPRQNSSNPSNPGVGIRGFLDIFDFFSKNNFPGSKK